MTEKDLEIQQLRRENADICRECDELIRVCERRSTEADKWHRMYDEEKTRTEALTSQRDLLMQENDKLRKELHELKERQKPKKPIEICEPCIKWGKCPACKGELNKLGRQVNHVFMSQKFCSDCGQALDWSGEDG